ncbi:uncharacterized protein [Dermacentor andersoni]|uniref:uncharacterized protein n=1 Tax=Dermacentor andersoni TaxID=34620 RepID=UPI003B3B712C
MKSSTTASVSDIINFCSCRSTVCNIGTFTLKIQASEIEETLFEDKTNLATLSLVKGPDGVRVTGLLSAAEKIQPALYGARHVSGGLPHIVTSLQRQHGSRTVMHESRKGIAYEGGLCTDHYVAIAEDIPGSYSGVLDAAHELGHSMGASHDGTPPNMQLGNHPGSLGCSPSSGHIMTYVDGGHLRYKFSECNKMEIRHLLRMNG